MIYHQIDLCASFNDSMKLSTLVGDLAGEEQYESIKFMLLLNDWAIGLKSLLQAFIITWSRLISYKINYTYLHGWKKNK